MQQDVRRSEPTEVAVRAEQEPKPTAKEGGFARSLFPFGSSKRNKEREEAALAEQGRLQGRLKDVLERDRALVAAEPPIEELSQDELELAEDDPFGASALEPATGTRSLVDANKDVRPAERDLLMNPFGDEVPQTGTRLSERASSELALSQIASWIEEEIGELAEDQGPLSLEVPPEVPLGVDEVAEIDAVLASPEPEPVRRSKSASAPRVPSSRASLTATVPAHPEEGGDAEPSREPINTRTMARLLAMQGYKPRALAVYRELLKRSPDDEALRAEAEALKNAD